jgi:hypothetical protein
MGIRLVMEAAGRAPAELTWRERYVLLVLAASAIDDSRECPAGIEDKPEIVTRLRLSRTQRYAVIAALCDKGVLLRMERGRNGVKASYAIAPFVKIPGLGGPGDPDLTAGQNGAKRPGDPDSSPVDNPAKRPLNRDPSEPVKGPGSENEASLVPGLKGPGFRDASEPDTVLRGFRDFKTGGGTPYPLAPQHPDPSALPDVPEGEHPDGEKPANGRNTHSIAAEICATRPDWSARSVARALENPSVADRDWAIACEAIRILAADPATKHPGRLPHDGPWWPEAERKTRAARARLAPEGVHEFRAGPDPAYCRDCNTLKANWRHPEARSA